LVLTALLSPRALRQGMIGGELLLNSLVLEKNGFLPSHVAVGSYANMSYHASPK